MHGLIHAGAVSLLLLVPAAHASDIPPSVPMSGFARYEFNKWLFRPCVGTGKTARLAERGLPFIDATRGNALFGAIQQRWRESADPLRGVFLEFAGYTEGGRVTATDLQRSLGWVESCAQRPANIPAGTLLWASGNEPFWSVSVDAHGATLRTPDGTVALPAAPLLAADGVTAFDATRDGRRLRIELVPGLCNDTMSEAAFGRKAVVAVQGRLHTGCGLVR